MTGIGSMTQDCRVIQGNTRAHHRNRSNKTGSWERKSEYIYIHIWNIYSNIIKKELVAAVVGTGILCQRKWARRKEIRRQYSWEHSHPEDGEWVRSPQKRLRKKDWKSNMNGFRESGQQISSVKCRKWKEVVYENVFLLFSNKEVTVVSK